MTIIKFYPHNAADNPDNVLEQAVGKYENVFVCGWDKNGDMDFRASTNMSQVEIAWLLEVFKQRLYAGEFDDEE